MKVDATAYQIPEIADCYRMEKKNIDRFAQCCAAAFRGYSYFEYLSQGPYNEPGISLVWAVTLRAMGKQVMGAASSENLEAVAIFTPPGFSGTAFMPYVFAGGIELVRRIGAKMVAHTLRYEEYAMEMKRKYTDHNSWYLYGFATQPQYQRQGHGKALLQRFLDYFDRMGQDCYLETLAPKNVPMYEQWGFQVMEEGRVPQTDIPFYAMLRKAKNGK